MPWSSRSSSQTAAWQAVERPRGRGSGDADEAVAAELLEVLGLEDAEFTGGHRGAPCPKANVSGPYETFERGIVMSTKYDAIVIGTGQAGPSLAGS